ncbi:MAG: molybdate ABC transporter substrate-binding protein [Coriobacteriales bacterium]|nr:molybdate ABC transporter substrate-binding protein [Coriobacteriales bacterium]
MKKKRVSLFARFFMVALLAFMLVLGMIACTQTEPKGKPAVELQIFAANSLEKALPEVQSLYTSAHPDVTFADTQFKGSGDLVSQIQGGAAADLLITASSGSMDTAENGGYIDAATRVDMFGNDLVVARGSGSDTTINSLADITGGNIKRIAIGDADSVPAGQYANQALNSAGLYSDNSGKSGEYDASIASKLAIGSSVGNVAKYIESGDCQIGFVYSSDIFRFTGIEVAYVVPSNMHKPIVYPGTVLSSSGNAGSAADFLDFCLTDPEAQKIWSKYGFEVL